jgi:predicted transcriptional regulator of viral defense system
MLLMVDKRQQPQIKKLGVFTLAQGKAAGISQQDISRLVAKRDLVRLGRGIYLHPKASLDKDVGFQIAYSKFGPGSAIGGLSALYHYNLAEQVPGELWVIVSPEKKTRETGYKLIRTKTRLDNQIKDEKGYRIVTVERAVLEGLKFITKIGERTAIKAAREALAQKTITEVSLARCANELRLETILAKHLQVIAP